MSRRKEVRIPLKTGEQTGLHVSHDGKTVRGDLVDGVIAKAREINEEAQGRQRQNQRQLEQTRERVAEAERRRASTSEHERRMDTKHEVAAALRGAGHSREDAERIARRAVERA